MTEPDLKTTLREFREYVAISCEPTSTIAARIGVEQWTVWDWLAGRALPGSLPSAVRTHRAILESCHLPSFNRRSEMLVERPAFPESL
jgi:hypothetical protein